MQMYRVRFQVHNSTMIDRGDVLCCASDKQSAVSMVLTLLSLPPSRAQCEVTRVKPSLFQLHRWEVAVESRPSMRNLGLR